MAGREKLSVGEICEKEGITAPFAYKILKKLEQAGYVRGYRGVHGGYALSKNTDSLTLLDIYLAIDPDMFIIECLDPEHKCARDGADGEPCMVHRELAAIQTELWNMLKRKNVRQILEGK